LFLVSPFVLSYSGEVFARVTTWSHRCEKSSAEQAEGFFLFARFIPEGIA
jgi:hypothetical protein